MHDGATVVVADLEPPQPDQPYMYELVDVTRVQSMKSLAGAVANKFGTVDILVNCAGVVHEASLLSTQPEHWQRILDINLTGTFNACRAFLPGMVEARYGRIINFASQLAISGADGYSAYAAAKAGVIAMTKSLAREVSSLGINANCVAPGPIDTPMLSRSALGWTPSREASLPIGRVGRPDEVAGTVSMLASERDGALYVGQVLSPNCGDII